MMADNSWVEYAPYPYMWIENCKGRTNGLGLETEGKEHTMEKMPEWDPEKIKTVSSQLASGFILKLQIGHPTDVDIVSYGVDDAHWR